MCRSITQGGRRCPHTPSKRASEVRRKAQYYLARKEGLSREAWVEQNPEAARMIQEKYEDNLKRFTAESNGSNTGDAQLPTFVSPLSVEQQNYFKDSKILDENGQLQSVYHGSASEFDEFDNNRTGVGNDSWGSGFYFTTQESVAKGYAGDTGSVKEYYLDIRNPLVVDGYENMSLNHIEINAQQTRDILRKHPHIYLQPEESDEYSSPLSDYVPEYWDKEEWSKEELDHMIDKMSREHFSDGTTFTNLEGMFDDNPTEFRNAVKDVVGWDGVVVKFKEKEDGQHIVAWFPEQIKYTSNQNPQIGNRLAD